MTGIEIASIVGVIIVGAGLIGTWIKNGRSQARDFGALKSDVKGIRNQLDDENYGLSALSEKINSVKTHCALTSGSFAERIKGVEDDVKEFKKKRR